MELLNKTIRCHFAKLRNHFHVLFILFTLHSSRSVITKLMRNDYFQKL